MGAQHRGDLHVEIHRDLFTLGHIQSVPSAALNATGANVLTINTIECALDADAGTAGAAGYVLGRSNRPAAFARGAYYAGDDDDGDGPAVWHGSPEALSQLGLEAGRAVKRDEPVAAKSGSTTYGSRGAIVAPMTGCCY